MTILFRSSPKSDDKILSVDSNFAEIMTVNSSEIGINFVFKIKLDSATKNPRNYRKVVVSLLPSTQFKQTTNFRSEVTDTKLNAASKWLQAPGSSTPSTGLNANFSRTYAPKSKISAASAARLNEPIQAIAGLNKRKTSYNVITSRTVYVDEKIKFALETPYEVVQFIVPETVKTSQDRLTEVRLNSNNILSEMNSNFMSLSNAFTRNTFDDETLFKKKIVDYFIQDTNKPRQDFLSALTFYKKKPSQVYLKSLEFPIEFNIQTVYKDSRFIAKFELFEKSSSIPEEVIEIPLDISKCFEAYNTLLFEPNVQTTNISSGFSNLKTTILSVSYDGFDKHKIRGYNVYSKSIDSSGEVTDYILNKVISVDETTYFSTVSFINSSESSLVNVRVIPYTDLGESNVFTDVLLGNPYPSIANGRLSLSTSQLDNERIGVRIDNISNQNESIKLYRRDCTVSQNGEFKPIKLIQGVKSSVVDWNDTSLITQHFYEYYAETFDVNGNTLQTSNIVTCQFMKLSETDYKISVSDLMNSSDDLSVSFSISAIATRPKRVDLLKSSISIIKNSPFSQTTVQTDTSVSPDKQSINKQDYNEVLFFLVSRLDTLTQEKHTFPIIQLDPNAVSEPLASPNAIVQTQSTSTTPTQSNMKSATTVFFDNQNTRALSQIPAPQLDRNYVYEVMAFKRDPFSSVKEFISTGMNNGKSWFYSPYKWNNPKVINTGILYEDGEDGIPQITDTQLLIADPVKIVCSPNVTFSSMKDSELFMTPFAEKLTKNIVKISWPVLPNRKIDSYVVVKVVNGTKQFLGKTSKPYVYHQVDKEDLGTVYYEITPITRNFMIQSTYFSNAIFLEENYSTKQPRPVL